MQTNSSFSDDMLIIAAVVIDVAFFALLLILAQYHYSASVKGIRDSLSAEKTPDAAG